MGFTVNGHWNFTRQMQPNSYKGFIYLVMDTYNETFYIGRKSYITRAQGRYLQSDWRNYVSSSNFLQSLIKRQGIENFAFIVLDEYKTSGGLSWAESWSIAYTQGPVNIRSMNSLLPEVRGPINEIVTDLHISRLEEAVNGDYETMLNGPDN